jgi:pyruvate dehydrogenase E1 component
LQHQDGHSHLLAGTIPNCVSYDPAYAYELAVILQDGLRRMYQEGENRFYYITTMKKTGARSRRACEGIRHVSIAVPPYPVNCVQLLGGGDPARLRCRRNPGA